MLLHLTFLKPKAQQLSSCRHKWAKVRIYCHRYHLCICTCVFKRLLQFGTVQNCVELRLQVKFVDKFVEAACPSIFGATADKVNKACPPAYGAKSVIFCAALQVPQVQVQEVVRQQGFWDARIDCTQENDWHRLCTFLVVAGYKESQQLLMLSLNSTPDISLTVCHSSFAGMFRKSRPRTEGKFNWCNLLNRLQHHGFMKSEPGRLHFKHFRIRVARQTIVRIILKGPVHVAISQEIVRTVPKIEIRTVRSLLFKHGVYFFPVVDKSLPGLPIKKHLQFQPSESQKLHIKSTQGRKISRPCPCFQIHMCEQLGREDCRGWAFWSLQSLSKA